MGEEHQVSLVPGRSCGPCMACCIVLPVRATGFWKAPSTTCTNCLPEGGCRIYEQRPDACRTYHCVWRQSPRLGDEWRPDRSGVLVTDEYDDVPEGYALRSGVRFILFGDHAVVRKPEFVTLITSLVNANMPVFLSIPGPPGCHSAKIFLNRGLDAAAKANASDQVSAVLEMAIAKLKTFPFTAAEPEG